MSVGKFLFDHIEIVTIGLSPFIVYVVYKLKKFKPRKNNLNSRYIKLRKQEEAINKRIKGGTIF